MHCLKKIKLSIFFSLWMALFFPSSIVAADNSLIIKTAEINSQFEAYFLNADFDLSFNDDLDEAIRKGIPINFVIEFELKKPRKYWFDEEVAKKTKEILLSYHALSKQFILTESENRLIAFDNLTQAKNELKRIKNWRIFDKSQIDDTEKYSAYLLVKLDQTKLPKQLQADITSNQEWQLASKQFQWTFVNKK
jgi:Leucine-rich repeat (LRR) protein